MQIELLISKEDIAKRIAELGEAIATWAKSEGDSLEVLWLAEGAFVFVADLVRVMDIDVRITSMKASSYGDAFKSSGQVNCEGIFKDFSGKNVLIVDDIFDTGLTLSTVQAMVRQAGAKTVKSCVLLRKECIDTKFKQPDFIGFSIPDKYVVGYGLDAAGKFRNLPDIKIITEV